MTASTNKLPATSLWDCRNYVGVPYGPGEWVTVDQAMIDSFGRTTHDEAWIHMDVDRARRAAPQGTTIAHGLLTLSLTPYLLHSAIDMSDEGKASGSLNYGYDRLRFLLPVPCDARLRLSGEVISAEPKGPGVLIRNRIVVEMEGGDRPAMSAEHLSLAFPEEGRPG